MNSAPSRAQPQQTTLTVNDNDFQTYFWPHCSEVRAEQTLFFVHATGFHARCWDQVIELLPEYDVQAIDMRGHGQSGKNPPYEWKQFGDDVAKITEQLELSNSVGIGHSMGGYALTEAVARQGKRFAGMVLIDPVITDILPDMSDGEPKDVVSYRKNDFESADAMFERFKNKQPYSWWKTEVLRDYCDFGLEANGDRYKLACPPDIESKVYLGAFKDDIFPMLAKIECPVAVLRAMTADAGAEASLSHSTTVPDLAQRFKNGEDFHYQELTHYIPMQDPQLIADHVRALKV